MKQFIFTFCFLFLGLLQAYSQEEVTRAELLQWYHDAQTAIKAGESDKAINIYERIRSKAPSLPEAYLKLGELYSGKNTLEYNKKALASYGQYLDLFPEGSERASVQTKVDQLTDKVLKGEVTAMNQKPEAKPAAKTEPAKPAVKQEEKAEVAKPVVKQEEKVVAQTEQKNTGTQIGFILPGEEAAEEAVPEKKAATQEDIDQLSNIQIGDDDEEENEVKPAGETVTPEKEAEVSTVELTSERNLMQEVLDEYSEKSGSTFEFKGYSQNEKSTHPKLKPMFQQKLGEASASTFALNDLGWMYLNGIGTEVDYKKAFSNFDTAADKENLFAFLNIGLCFEKGIGLEKADYEKAISYYTKAAEKGYGDAYVMAGDLYMEMAQQNPSMAAKAVSSYQQAYFKNIPAGIYKLGVLYYTGKFVEKDATKGMEYMTKAANMQYGEAMLDLAIFYLEGTSGFQKDETKGLDMLLRASRKNNIDAMLQLAKMNLKTNNMAQCKTWLEKACQTRDTEFVGFSSMTGNVKKILFP